MQMFGLLRLMLLSDQKMDCKLVDAHAHSCDDFVDANMLTRKGVNSMYKRHPKFSTPEGQYILDLEK